MNLKKCLFCQTSLLNEKNKFCNHSCSAAFNNSKRNLKKYNLTDKAKQQVINRVNKNLTNYYSSPNECQICSKTLEYKNRYKKTCESNFCLTKSFSNNAIKNNIGGNRNGKSSWYESIIAGKVYLESSYEITIAKILDDLKINWCRPKPLNYIDSNNIKHKYYPDFLLIDYNIYLDPKNKYLIELDKEKIMNVIKQTGINLLVLSKDQLNEQYVKELISRSS